ncbi:MAG: extracellular solute-binding protein [Candidatus Paceibacterota bacterium]|jgi:multiple sugar transport system substrate-binding protein
MSKFQVITLAIFILAIVAGVIAFATYKNDSTTTALPSITIWGTFPSSVFDQYVAETNNTLDSPVKVSYVEKTPEKFSQEFVSALARGLGPDVILIPADRILTEANKLTSIPYTALTQREFKDKYIQEAQIYLNSEGTLALPFTIDPLVLYWNRDIFNVAGLVTFPRYWDEFSALNQKLTVKDQNGNIRKSAVAFGTFNNITNAREILGTLIMQAGNTITGRDADGAIVSTLGNRSGSDPAPAVKFFAKFADPANTDYSWNRGLLNDKVFFLAGNLATYIGLASEISDIRSKNNNLNFDVAPLPQTRNGGKTVSYGRMYGFSIVRASGKQNAAYQTIAILSSPSRLQSLSQKMYIPSVLNTLNQGSSDPYMDNFQRAALISRTWLDADPTQSRRIWGTMIDVLISGKKSVSDAISDAHDEYDLVLKQAVQ